MLVYLRTSSAGFDVRLKKYIYACEATNTPYLAITWNRLMNADSLPNEYSYQHAAPYGYGHRMKNFFLLFGWYLFAIKLLLVHRKQYKIIHACNLETAVVAYMMKLLLGKKMVFDIYDTSGRYGMERFLARKADLFILPHERRLQQNMIKKEEIKHFLQIENVPVFDVKEKKEKGHNPGNTIKLSYVGTFEREIRGLETLLDVVEKDDNFLLDIAGTGYGMDSMVCEISKRCERITYYGAVPYDKALKLMWNSDYIVAMYNYPLSHKYACPNKFYESLMLGVPIITTKDTLIGDWVKNVDSGFQIPPDYDSFKNLLVKLASLPAEIYQQKAHNCKECWQTRYADYQKTQLEGEYLKMCRDIALN